MRNSGAPTVSASFFPMLGELLSAELADVAIARTRKGELASARVDILGTQTRHFYYGVSDRFGPPALGPRRLDMAGGASWNRLHSTSFLSVAVSERYKYRYAERVHEWYALRGFYAPCEIGRSEEPKPAGEL